MHALEAALDQVTQKRRPAGLVLLGALADALNLPKTLRIDGTGHQERNIANLAGLNISHFITMPSRYRYGCSPSMRRIRHASILA
jgi:hypothetical protein